MELINKEELRDKMYHEAFEVDSDLQKWESGCWIRYKLFEKILDQVTIMEIRPKGEWIKKGDYAECSICGAYSGVQYNGVQPVPLMTNYCHNCGADMRGLKNDNGRNKN